MNRWIAPLALVALIAVGLAYLFTYRRGEPWRQQVAKQGQTLRKQTMRTVDQLSNQLQEGAEDVLTTSRQFMRSVTNKLTD